jgi:hypothetical protein
MNQNKNSHNATTGEINYDSFHYNTTKSIRNRSFMNAFESEFNRGFRPKYGFNNTQKKGDQSFAPRRPGANFKNWNNALSRNF